MTRQQAGVSAEAVAKLVAKWRERGSELARRGEVSVTLYAEGMRLQLCADELEALATAPPPEHKGMMISDSRKQEAHERIMERQPATPYSLHCAQIRNDALEEAATLCTNQEAYDNDSEDPVMAEKIRALKTVATAPPEQAAREDSWSKLERHTKALAKVHPQAASAGALSAEQVLEEAAAYIALRLPERLPLRGNRDEAKKILLRLLQETLAPHDQATLRDVQSAGPHIHSEAYGVTKEQCPACIAELTETARNGTLNVEEVRKATIESRYNEGKGSCKDLADHLNAALAAHDQAKYEAALVLATGIVGEEFQKLPTTDSSMLALLSRINSRISKECKGALAIYLADTDAAHDQKVRADAFEKAAHLADLYSDGPVRPGEPSLPQAIRALASGAEEKE